MNWKCALLLFVVLFVPAVASATLCLNTLKLDPYHTLEKTALRIVFKPTGDPIDDPIGPH